MLTKTDKTIFAIIPARKDSKGVPGKNMKLLGGKPLIQYTIETALQSKLLTKIIVSSDCRKTIAFSKNWSGIEAPFLRPRELAMDETPTIAVVQHAVNFYKKDNTVFDYVCLLQPTSPFRSPDLIDNTIMHMLKQEADSLITVEKICDDHHPHWAFHKVADGLQQIVPQKEIPVRRQDLQEAYCRDGKIYLLKTSLLDHGLLMGGRLVGYCDANQVNVNINGPEDWDLAEIYIEICNRRKNDPS